MYDNDTSSNVSFEDIGRRRRVIDREDSVDEHGLVDKRVVDRLKAIVAKSTAEGTKEIADGEVPDVVYSLTYQGIFDREPKELHRSTEPINIQEFNDEYHHNAGRSTQKPVLEIITRVRAAPANQRGARINPGPPPMYSDDSDDDVVDIIHEPPRRGNHDGMNVTDVEETVMVINSVYLINALRAVVDYYPDCNFMGNTLKVNAPYHVLVHHRQQLAHYKTHQPEAHDEDLAAITAKHIDVLLGFLEKTHGEELREEENRHLNSKPTTIFKNLWMLFKPGDVVCAKKGGKWREFVVCRCDDNSPWFRGDEAPYTYKLEAWNIVYAHGKLRRFMHSLSIPPFTGEDAISNLRVIPVRFFKNDGYDTAKSIELGKAAWNLSKGPAYMSYNGTLADKGADTDGSNPTSTTGYMNGRVIVDCDGFARFAADAPGDDRHRYGRGRPRRSAPPRDQLPYFKQRCGCTSCKTAGEQRELHQFAKFEDLSPARDPAPENDLYYLVFSKTLPGFILGERRWAHFNVESLSEIKYDKEAFKYLVLDDEIKLTVKALIGKFSSVNGRVTPWPSDFVKNKGQGRIFLLHGSPGVGKTATCESIAELAHRPLLSLTSGDLSTNSYTVEKNLEYFLQLGERFGAMVLLDEADVYLEARQASDIARNGLVSIFLRALEYYRGVLFLTTNRVRAFDSAFTSRIHVALHYRPLTDADRERVWLSGFARLERDAGGAVRVSAALRDYAYGAPDVRRLRWNGREIRNALQTAVAMAETEALEDGLDTVTVTDKHLRAVVKMSRGFKEFLGRRRLRRSSRRRDEEEEQMEEEQEEDEYFEDDEPRYRPHVTYTSD
ncbi:uncharacterized protein JN550_006369 [Neoarthrinium moseri]|uniref:uncharacterized protein n=1 Tax=Neoarthrinium moseri TaxID=1658444 RepID=UPI001FDAFF53|nr:uncharacterized protein JN550_006369 [Neoarthrinium moseri]KAI1868453.1 hypothetical protein JN550_006369 [Neoarthrinium moseri]